VSEPKRIQRKRIKGWTMPDGAVYVGRPSKWGNPFALGLMGGEPTGARQAVADDYRRWLTHHHGTTRRGRTGEIACWCLAYGDRDAVLADIGELAGKTLACWCPAGQPCHAGVLLELANRKAAS
jgi:hypothetical protein